MLQSSLLGFDLSRISSGSFGAFGGFSSSNSVISQPSPTPVQPVRAPTPVIQPQAQTNDPITDRKITNNAFRGVILYHEIPEKFLLN
jgi:hypothetical protein